MNKKIVFLFIALLLPGLIYTFLKLFGSNSFAVAPLFQDEIMIPEGCPEVMTPYHLPKNLFPMLASKQEQDSLVLVFYMMDEAKLGSNAGNMNEIEKYISQGKDGVQLVRINQDTIGLKCSLLIGTGIDIVLLDKENIRGQYISTDRDEVDRLSTELDIILKKY